MGYCLLFLFTPLSFSQTMNDINIVPQPVKMKIENRFAKFQFPIYIFFDKADNKAFIMLNYLQNELLKRKIPNGISIPEKGKWNTNIALKD